MNRKKVLSMMMTAVLTFTSVVPQPALYANAEGDIIIDEVSEEYDEETVSDNDSRENTNGAVSCNGAEDESVSDNNAESISEDEAVSDNAVYENKLPTGIKGMPEGYALSEREAEIKADMINHDVLIELKNAVAGVDYVEDQVYCVAETEEYAQQIADAYGIELVEYAYSVAIFNIDGSGRDVYETIELSMNETYSLPPLTPNYICQLKAEENDDRFINEMYAIRSGQPVNMPGDWDSVRELLGDGLDPLLKPNDPNYQWWHDMMDTYAAWGVYGTDCSESGIKVAVIDGRVYDSHEDLSGNVKVSDVAGGGSSAINGHGTQIAGIIGAKAGNALGGAGIAPGVQIYSLSCAKEEGTIEGAYVTACLKYLENSDINIACMGFAGSVYDANQKDAIQNAYEKGITVLAPVGEDNSKQDQYDHVISVGAVKQDGSKMIISGSAKDQADVYAPGVEMMSTYSDGSYKAENGTSMACAAAAGACALYMSVNGSVGPDEMEEVLTQNTIKGKSLEKGVGIVNISEMLGNGTAGPKLEIYDNGELVKTVDGGKSAVVTVNSSAYIRVKPILETGEINNDQGLQVFFTVNGKAPSFKNGIADTGTFCLTEDEADLEDGDRLDDLVIPLQSYLYMLNNTKQKITVKLVCVTSMGVISRTTAVSVSFKQRIYEGISLTDIPTGEVAAGCSVKLGVYLVREDILGNISEKKLKNANWEIESGSDIAEIGKNGVLKTFSGKTGEVTVICSYKNCRPKSKTIKISNFSPIKSITLSEKRIKTGTKHGETLPVVSITSVKNCKGEDILSENNIEYCWSSSNSSVATTDMSGKSVKVYPAGKGTATITCKAMDGSGVKARFRVKVFQQVVGIEIFGQDCVAVGSLAAFKSKVYGPRDMETGKEKAKPADKSVTWFVSRTSKYGLAAEADDGRIKIDQKKGIVSISEGCTLKGFYVYARSNDGSKVYNVIDKYVKITGQKITSLSLTTEASDSVYQIKRDKKGSISALNLYTVDAASNPVDESRIIVKAIMDSDPVLNWKSSNESVAVIEQIGENQVVIAKGAGTARITCIAEDGSGKKSSFKVKVVVPVSHLMLINEKQTVYPGGDDGVSYVYLGKGKETVIQVTAGDSYGKPDNPKVKWSYAIVGYDENNRREALDEATIEKAEKAKLFSVIGPKVKINKNYNKLCTQNGLPDKIGLMITATSTDGSNVSDSMLIIPVEP